MDRDSGHLTQLGERASLENVIACWFYQSAMDDCGDLRQIASQVVVAHSPEELQLIRDQIESLLAQSDEEVVALWDSQAGYTFPDASEARYFFQLFAAMLHRHQSA